MVISWPATYIDVSTPRSLILGNDMDIDRNVDIGLSGKAIASKHGLIKRHLLCHGDVLLSRFRSATFAVGVNGSTHHAGGH